MFVKCATIRLIASLDSMTYSLQSGIGEKCYSNIFTAKLAFSLMGEGLLNSPDQACWDFPRLWHPSSWERQFLRCIQQIPLPDLESLTRCFCWSCHRTGVPGTSAEVSRVEIELFQLPLRERERQARGGDDSLASSGRAKARTSLHSKPLRTDNWPVKGLYAEDECLSADWFHSVLPFEWQVLLWEQERNTRSNDGGGFWERKKSGMEKLCNLTVATADVQVRIHIWNFSLPGSKHAEGALNRNSGYGTT